MKDCKVGDIVELHPYGSKFEVVEIVMRKAKLVEVRTREAYPLTPISMLDLVDRKGS